jgi:hypothetical protein
VISLRRYYLKKTNFTIRIFVPAWLTNCFLVKFFEIILSETLNIRFATCSPPDAQKSDPASVNAGPPGRSEMPVSKRERARPWSHTKPL